MIPLPDVVSRQCRQPGLEGTGEIKLRRLVKEALRMRPSRIVVGEVRQEECADLAFGRGDAGSGSAQESRVEGLSCPARTRPARSRFAQSRWVICGDRDSRRLCRTAGLTARGIFLSRTLAFLG
jgi:type II/IV secretion system protein